MTDIQALTAEFVEKYARGPTQTTVDRAISLHENVRQLLGDQSYATILQGSYKNDTALADMNDVDVLVVSRIEKTLLVDFNQKRRWEKLFSEIESKLESSHHYAGKWKREDKCIRLNTSVCIDVVPAMYSSDPQSDPISIYSFNRGAEKKNWPRGHHEACATKSKSTNGAFKKAVRLFKRWSRCQFADRETAPSYYIECLLFSAPNALFSGDLRSDFVAIANYILQTHGVIYVGSLSRPAGAGNLLDGSEWASGNFLKFRAALKSSLVHAQDAVNETDADRAKAAWRRAFAGHDA